MEKGDVWGPKGGGDMRGMVVIEAVHGDAITAFPRGGGFMARFLMGEFTEAFEPYSSERLAAMASSFERGLVGLDSFKEGQDIPCWLNGESWNGWEKPFFERKDIDAAFADGRLVSNEYSLVEFDEAAGSYVEIMPVDGSLPKDLDRAALVELAVRAGGGGEFGLPGGGTAYVSISPSLIVDTADGPAAVYNVGDGWTWSRPPALTAAMP